MEMKNTDQVTKNVAANNADSALPVMPKKEFVEPEVSEPVDILAATKFFLQVTGGGDV